MSQSTKEYENALKRLLKKFKEDPYSYFSECELQYDFYCILKSLKSVNQTTTTNDGIKVGSVHPEYPSAKRVQLKNGKGYRVWFDLAILDPDFIKLNGYKTIWARDERSARAQGKNVLAAFEFKYFPTKRLHDIELVQQDCLKLSLCPEIASRYVLVFSYYKVDDSELERLELGNTKLYWTTPYNTKVLHGS